MAHEFSASLILPLLLLCLFGIASCNWSDTFPDVADSADAGLLPQISDEISPRQACHYVLRLGPGARQMLNDSGRTLDIRVMDINRSIIISLDDKEIVMREGIDYPITISGHDYVLSLLSHRADQAIICIDNKTPLDETFCASRPSGERRMCFDYLGYSHGLDFCETLSDSTDRRECRRGAKGQNG